MTREPSLELFAHSAIRYFAATRPAFLTASLMACLIGWAYSVPPFHLNSRDRGYVLIVALAYGWLVASVLMGWLPMLDLLALFVLPLSVQAARPLLRHALQPRQLADAIKLTIAAMMAHGALLSIGLTVRCESKKYSC